MNDLDFKIKYIKYKLKYLELKQKKQSGGMELPNSTDHNAQIEMSIEDFIEYLTTQYKALDREFDLEKQNRARIDETKKIKILPRVSNRFWIFLENIIDLLDNLYKKYITPDVETTYYDLVTPLSDAKNQLIAKFEAHKTAINKDPPEAEREKKPKNSSWALKFRNLNLGDQSLRGDWKQFDDNTVKKYIEEEIQSFEARIKIQSFEAPAIESFQTTSPSPSSPSPSLASVSSPQSSVKLTSLQFRTRNFKANLEKLNSSADLEEHKQQIRPDQFKTILNTGLLDIDIKIPIIEILNKYVKFFYKNYGHSFKPDRNLVELISDIVHDKDMPSRAYKLKRGAFNNEDTNSLFYHLIDKYSNMSIDLAKDLQLTQLMEAVEQYGSDPSISFITDKEICPFSAVAVLKDVRYQNYDVKCTPITELYPDNQNDPNIINLHFKDKGAAFGKYGNKAFESEIDGLQKLQDYPINRHYTKHKNQIYYLMNYLGANRFIFYETIMTEYYIKMLDILEVNSKYNDDFEFKKIKIHNGQWYLYFLYKKILYKIDITGRGSTDKSYDLISIQIRILKLDDDTNVSPGMYEDQYQGYTDSILIENLEKYFEYEKIDTLTNESFKDLYSIINLLVGLLAKSAGDDTQRTLLFSISKLAHLILSEEEKIYSSETTHDRQLLSRLLNVSLSNEIYNYDTNLNVYAVYRTSNKLLQKFLLGTASSYNMEFLIEQPKINYYKFEINSIDLKVTSIIRAINENKSDQLIIKNL